MDDVPHITTEGLTLSTAELELAELQIEKKRFLDAYRAALQQREIEWLEKHVASFDN